MPTIKIGSASHVEMSEAQMKHFDLDVKIGEQLSHMDLRLKEKFVTKLPAFIEAIKAEGEQKDREVI